MADTVAREQSVDDLVSSARRRVEEERAAMARDAVSREAARRAHLRRREAVAANKVS